MKTNHKGIEDFIYSHRKKQEIMIQKKKTRRKTMLFFLFLPIFSIFIFSSAVFPPSNKNVSRSPALTISLQDAYYLTLVPEEYRDYVYENCVKRNIPITYYYRMIWNESRWRWWAVGKNYYKGKIVSYDRGLGQINSKYEKDLALLFFIPSYEGEVFDVFNWQHNLQVSMNYIEDLYETFGNWPEAFMAYNCGYNAVKNNQIPERTYEYVKKIIY